MYQLDAPYYFYFLGIIPILVIFYLLVALWKKKTQKRFGSAFLLNYLSPNRSTFKQFLKFAILCLGITFLIIGLINPKIGSELKTIKREGADIVFLVDISKSMLAEDIAPNRLEKTKHLISNITDQLIGDRIGIIIYAAKSIPLLPITTDFSSAKMFLQGIDTKLLSSQGTSIDAAIDLAGTFFDDEEQPNRIIFLMSDGEDHSENAKMAARRAAALGIKIFTIGVGTEKGAPIPIKNKGVVERYKKDSKGEVVITKRNSDILTDIAKASGGSYQDGNQTKEVLDFTSDLLKKINRKEFESKSFASYKDQFQIFLLIAFCLFFIDVFILETKTKWIEKLNIFNEKKI